METIKEEKKADLEQLLNSLIKRGRVPFGIKKIEEINYVKHNGTLCWYLWGGSYQRWKSIRELVSKESGLWQFVCENGMIKHEVYEDIQSWEHTTAEHSDFWYTSGDNYEYRLIESSLKDESELEDFLLNSIKLD